MQKEVKIFTETERNYLIKVLELLEVEFKEEKVESNEKEPISYFKFTYAVDMETTHLIEHFMVYNYKKNMIR